MTTPMSVSTERSLLAQRDWSAILNASLSSITNPGGRRTTSLAAHKATRDAFCDQKRWRTSRRPSLSFRVWESTQTEAQGRFHGHPFAISSMPPRPVRRGLLDVGAFGDLCCGSGRTSIRGLLLHLLVLFVLGGAGAEESGDVGLVGRRLDAHGEGSGGAGGVLGFVAADGVSEGVFGDRPGTVEGVAVGGSGEQGCGAGDAGTGRAQGSGNRDQDSSRPELRLRQAQGIAPDSVPSVGKSRSFDSAFASLSSLRMTNIVGVRLGWAVLCSERCALRSVL